MEIAIVIGLLVAAVVLFAMEVVSVDITTLLLLMALVLFGILTPEEAFLGFSTDIIIILASIFVLSGAMQRAGVVDVIGARLLKVAGTSLNGLLTIMMPTIAVISAFMNNTTVTAVFVAPIVGVARRMKVAPSKVLIPLAYASILGGTCTLIGTSTNVAVSGYIAKTGMKPIGLFEMAPIGLVMVVVGIAYMLLFGKRLLPDHADENLTEEYAIREYLSEIIVVPDSHLIGQRIFESDLAQLGFRILEVVRGKRRILPQSVTVIAAGDILLVKGKVEDLIKVKTTTGIEIRPDLKMSDPELPSEDLKIAEVLISPRSELIGQTLKGASFRQRFGLVVLAIYRDGQALQEKIGNIRLRLGDLLLVQGQKDYFNILKRERDFTILGELNPSTYRRRKGGLVALVFILAVVAGGFGWMPLSISFLFAAVLTVLTKSISIEEAYEMIDWRLLILIGGMTAFGLAMEKTGTAEFLAEWVVYFLKPLGVHFILAGFFVLTIILTQPMSNAAAALVVLPVAISVAQELGVNERTFAVAIMLAASVSFITPLEPSCILVYGPGKYRFRDFVRVGTGLTVLLFVIVLILLPTFWPLTPAIPSGAR